MRRHRVHRSQPHHARCPAARVGAPAAKKATGISMGARSLRRRLPARSLVWVGALAQVIAAGCRQDMHDQPRLEPLQASSFFADGRASRPLVEGTVARGFLRDDSPFYTGKSAGELVEAFPLQVTSEVVERGQERYDIFCSPCHDRVGSGNGIVVQRGFRRPASFHTERLRAAPVGHFFDAMTSGFGSMLDYGDRIPPQDRWAIVAYVRALQLSQHAALSQLPAETRARLESGGDDG